MKNNFLKKLTVFYFFFIILLPTLGMILGINSQTDNTEYRRLLKKPQLKDSPFSAIPKNITDYYNDNFGFRNVFLKLFGEVKLNILNTHPSYSSILGNNGWIFMNSVIFPTTKKWYQQTEFSDEQLSKAISYLQSEKDWLAKQNIPYVLIIIPYKEHVYPEEYPFPNHIPTKRLLEQFLSYAKNNSTLDIIDLRDPLIKAKSSYPIYYHTDSHWNQWGAFIGYQEIGKKLNTLPNFHLYTTEDFEITPEYYNYWIGDLMRTSAVWKNRTPDVGVKFKLKSEIEKMQYPKLDSIFVYGDSFADSKHYANRQDFLEQFPELEDRLTLIFQEPLNSESLRIKAPLDTLLPILSAEIDNKSLFQRLKRYLINFRLLDDETIGINYFLKYNFSNLHFKQRQDLLEKELVVTERPKVVVREIIEQVLFSTIDEFSRVNF